MGHTFVPADEGTLYGFKTDIKEQLAEGNPPEWLREWRRRKGGTVGYCTESTLEEKIEEGAKRARERRESLKESDFHEYNGGATATVELPIEPSILPDRVQERLSVTREDAQEYTGFHHVSHREYRIQIAVGPRGGIEDVRLGRDFHH